MSPAVLLLGLALAVPPAGEGLPASAAAVFHEMDRSLTAGDLEGLLALFDEDYRSPSAVDRVEKIASVVRSLRARYADIQLRTTILEGKRLDGGEAAAVTVDHRLAFNGSSRTIGKTYVLRRDDAGSWRIRFGVDVEEDGPRMPGPPEVKAPLIGVAVSAPEDWISLSTRRGLLIREDFLVHPAMDRWISVGVLDPGARTPESLFAMARWRLERAAPDRVRVLERGIRTFGPLEGPYMRLLLEAEGGPGRIIEITYLARDGLLLRLAWSGPGDVAVPDPGSLFGVRMLSHGEVSDTIALHRAGHVHGRRYHNEDAGIRFSVPRGWSLRIQASPFPYLTQGVGPGGEILQVGAWRMAEGPEGAARTRPRGGAEVTVGGRSGWRAPGTAGITSVYVRGEDGLIHFFTLEGSDRDDGDLLDRILARVEWIF